MFFIIIMEIIPVGKEIAIWSVVSVVCRIISHTGNYLTPEESVCHSVPALRN